MAFESLEARKLLSVSLTEAEPNDVRTRANVIERALGDHVLVGGKVNALGDRD